MKLIFGGIALFLTAIRAAHADVPSTFSKEVRTNLYHQVVLEDVLGEGEGAWDVDPRYPVGKVNCMVWLQLLLAETYAKDKPQLKQQIMDRVRYYGGVVSFGTRKHFVDHWLMTDPAPLKPIDMKSCLAPVGGRLAKHSVQLDFKSFTSAQSYNCSLHKEQQSEHVFEYVKLKDFKVCAKTLSPGHYILFAVPSSKFLNRTIKTSGPMGLVHSIVLEVQSVALANDNGVQNRGPLVFHASTAGKHVKIEPLEIFLKNSSTIHQGYAVYRLDPEWNPTAETLAADAAAVRAAAAATLSCEAALPKPRKKKR